MAIADIARKVEKTINTVGVKRSSQKGWVPAVKGYAGYGTSKRAHVLGRVLMEKPESEDREDNWAQRGYRQFFTIQVGGLEVKATVGDATVTGHTNDNGYVDLLVHDHGLEPGWHEVTIYAEGAEPATAEVLIVDDEARIGLISDIDDTTMVTWLPRALIAAYNSWFKRTDKRKPVEGMADFYKELLAEHPNAPTFYLSTGAWNTYDTLTAFMEKHGFPKAPMLLTDWGPTQTKLFRSGAEHKKVQLRNLIIDFPEIQWVLVGDDGQHDPTTYSDLVYEHPNRVAGVAIRNLSAQEHLLAHGTATPLSETDSGARTEVPMIQGEDGHKLLKAYREKPFERVEEDKRTSHDFNCGD
ncbi:App1 family protein [Corynebacterium endometrii]|uniref:Phosphatidate phosphatase APP1 catalytic domain-containing protein n=1 Tax=Corynebacterium endometrii TaxID=2488819 RepID=A0A4V1CEJ8_9CORY|nr:phosphatase domain-containing protein [Corynebacterium endometrii]QCB28358.1 hypothetical protein CENDO_05370 [Corynebacterium endometrii]